MGPGIDDLERDGLTDAERPNVSRRIVVDLAVGDRHRFLIGVDSYDTVAVIRVVPDDATLKSFLHVTLPCVIVSADGGFGGVNRTAKKSGGIGDGWTRCLFLQVKPGNGVVK